MSLTNPHVDKVHDSTTASAVDTDGNGDTVVTLSGLRSVASPADATAQAAGGYVAGVQGVSGNEVTVRIYQEGDSGGALVPVTGAADVTDVHVQADGS